MTSKVNGPHESDVSGRCRQALKNTSRNRPAALLLSQTRMPRGCSCVTTAPNFAPAAMIRLLQRANAIDNASGNAISLIDDNQ